ncbi:MAG: helix-turn-helix domain-containing protein [Nanoarchaeota archaeon]|nr:helix-turn-helix domain-containing protein [Nanoarchaeota archaeon]
MIEEVLRKIGLTAYETKVYLALIELGKATSGEILQQANLNTGKIYDILGSLKTKGFISEIIESGVKKFSPADPKRIYDYLGEKKKDIEKQEESLKDIVPNLLKKINHLNEQQKVEVFYGFKGLKTAHQKEIDRYSSKETVRFLGVMGRGKYPQSLYDFYVLNLYSKRKDSKVKIRKILDNTSRKFRKDHEKEAQIKFFPYTSPVAIVTIGNLTIIEIITENPIIITIESKKVAESFIQQFELLWKISER